MRLQAPGRSFRSPLVLTASALLGLIIIGALIGPTLSPWQAQEMDWEAM